MKIVNVQINLSEDDIHKVIWLMLHNPTWEANSFSTEKFPTFSGTWGFITMFIRGNYGLCPEPDESSPILSSCICVIHFNVILLSTLQCSKQSISSGVLTKPLYWFWFSFMHALCPSNFFHLFPANIQGLPFSPQAQQLSSVEHQHLPGYTVLSTIIKVTLSTYSCHVLCKFVALKM
jgi:hypothetical protein